MRPLLYSAALSFLCLATACGGESTGNDSTKDIDPTIPCPSGNCGDIKFRSAVPSRDSVRIQMGREARRFVSNTPTPHAPGVGSTQQALASVSPALLESEEYVADINFSIESLFQNFEELASTEPDVVEENLHIWRGTSDDDPSLDELLVVTAIDAQNYAVELRIGPSDFAASDGTTVVYGNVELDGDDVKTDFELFVDLDAATDVIDGLDATGEIRISAQPLESGVREVWYDFDEVGGIGEDLETSRTTYWIFDATQGALEYLYDVHDESATVYVRWGENGGRYDHHVEWQDEQYGLVDEIFTNCWDSSGGEVFDAAAIIDENLSYYGELDGEELDCEFGPVEDHPSPGTDFENLPGEGEWDDIDFGGDIVDPCEGDPNLDQCGEAPFCDEAPEDPECIPWCDDEPDDPDCEWYCDWVDDPDYCDTF